MVPLRGGRVTAGIRTTYLDWCSDALGEEAYAPSEDYAVEVDLATGIAYTRECGRPLLKEELLKRDEDPSTWLMAPPESERKSNGATAFEAATAMSEAAP